MRYVQPMTDVERAELQLEIAKADEQRNRAIANADPLEPTWLKNQRSLAHGFTILALHRKLLDSYTIDRSAPEVIEL